MTVENLGSTTAYVKKKKVCSIKSKKKKKKKKGAVSFLWLQKKLKWLKYIVGNVFNA